MAFATTADAVAETLWSGPMNFCKSPKASIIARRALVRAMLADEPWDDALSEMLESVSKPTAMIVSRIIKLRVTTKAKPLLEEAD